MLTCRLGPDDGTLSVRTQRTGAAGMAGDNLLIHATRWNATIELGPAARVEVEVDGSSLRVIEGSGAMQALQDEDKQNIEQTIDDEVLHGELLTLRSSKVARRAAGLRVDGALRVNGAAHPVAFDLAITADGGLEAVAVVKQSDWGMKP